MSGFVDADLVAIRPDGCYWRTPYDPEVVRQQVRAGRLHVEDGRQISDQQRKNIWAMIGEIASHSGYLKAHEKTELNNVMKVRFLTECFDRLTAAAIGQFSTGDVDVTTAAMYQTFLLDYILENDIPTRQPIRDYCEDIRQAVYACLVHKKCIVCGKPATLHHVDHVGMGRSRNDICHVGMRALPLCWPDGGDGHHPEIHRIGDKAFLEKYHLEPVEIDEKIARMYKLGRR